MIAEFGHYLLCLAAACSLFGAVAVWAGHVKGQQAAAGLWRVCTPVAALCLAVATGILLRAFLIDDFSIAYVADHSNTKLDVIYKAAALWGSHEGSMLLWILLMALATCLVAFTQRKNEALNARIQCTMLAVIGVFCAFVLTVSNPFLRNLPAVPSEGRDLNPILQDIGMILHPPVIFAAYAGLAVIFAVIVAVLWQKRMSPQAVSSLKRIGIVTWILLTAGNALGSWWAYCELGWGGWWFWDPVENASLLPWLSATALLHSLSLTRQRGIFRHWSLLLAIVTLMLSLLGTLIVRSGILVSVHAFALDNVRAVPLFSLFALISLASLALYGWRARDGGPAVRFSGLSREMLILATLLLFCAVLLIVLVGTLYPMIYGLLGWGRLSVGAPYFNRATLPFALLMLVVIVLATFVSGKRAQLPALLAHAGVLLFAAGIVVSSVSRQEISLNLQPGQQVTLAGYTFRFERLDLQAKGNYTSEKAIVALFDHQQRIGELTPERRFYEARRQQMMEPSIRWNGIHDWYAVMGEKTGADRYAFRLYVQSGVRWIWGGGLLMISGALLSGWRGRQRDE